MTNSATLTQSSGQVPAASGRAVPSSARRRLQLVLAGLWVLDGVLKLQPFMFTKDVGPMTIGDAGTGAPNWLADPMNWVQKIIVNHPVGPMVVFALAELAVGFAIAYRPTVRYGLIACLCWVPFLWFLAEGLGGLTADSGPFGGAPGASILYGLLAVLLWPTDRPGTSEAARFVGVPRRPDRLGGALGPARRPRRCCPRTGPPTRSPTSSPDNVSGTPQGYTSLLNHAASWTEGRGNELGITLAVLLALVAVSVLIPDRRVVRAGLVLAIVIATIIWVLGEGLGMPFMGMATDPDTGPLLAVIAIAFWPVANRLTASAEQTPAASAEGAAA